jgi:hypothetical protein
LSDEAGVAVAGAESGDDHAIGAGSEAVASGSDAAAAVDSSSDEPLDSGARLGLLGRSADGAGSAVTPVASRIAPIRVALLARALVLIDIAWAIDWSSSRSLVSSRVRSNWGPDVMHILSLTPDEAL